MSATAPIDMTADGLAKALPDGIPQGLLGKPKRLLDIVLSTVILVFLAPLLLGIAIAIKLFDGGPVLFRHQRCGQNGQHFTLLKFRTMHLDAEARLEGILAADAQAKADWQNFRKLRNDPRVTKLGHFLRRSSLDELPQLLNIFGGNMSMVGPRPIMDDELVRFGALASVYKAARPGLTGLWQISGRNGTDFMTRIDLDVTYVREWSLRRDLMILFKTIPVVLLAKGAY